MWNIQSATEHCATTKQQLDKEINKNSGSSDMGSRTQAEESWQTLLLV